MLLQAGDNAILIKWSWCASVLSRLVRRFAVLPNKTGTELCADIDMTPLRRTMNFWWNRYDPLKFLWDPRLVFTGITILGYNRETGTSTSHLTVAGGVLLVQGRLSLVSINMKLAPAVQPLCRRCTPMPGILLSTPLQYRHT